MRTSRDPRIILAFGALCFIGACNRGGKAVARVGDATVRQAQWSLFVSELPRDTSTEAALQRLVRREVAWQQAERTGLLKTSGWLEIGPKLRRTVLGRVYLDAQPGPAMPGEAEVRGFFLSHGEERQVAHLLCATEAEAQAARRRLEKGEPFPKVADGASKDPSVKKNHGEIGWIKRQAVVPEFGKAAFEAKVGDLVGPVKSEYGYHVILVKAQRVPTATDFELRKAALMEEARELARAPRREPALKALRTTFPLSVDTSALALTPTPLTAAVDGQRIAGKVGGVGLTLKELEAFIFDAMGPGGPDHSLSPGTKQRFLELLADEHRLALAALKAGFDKKPEVQAELWQAERSAVYNGFSASYLRTFQISETDLAAHLAAHPDRFAAVEAVRLHLLVAQDPAAAERALSEAAKGAPWKTLVGKYANVPSTGEWDPGFLPMASLKKLLPPEALKAIETGPLEALVGPVPGPEGPMIFRVLERRAGQAQALDQCREAVKKDYLQTRGAACVEAYLDGEGRKGIPIEVFAANALR